VSAALAPPSPLDVAYQSQRLRLSAAVTAAAATTWARGYRDRQLAVDQTVQIVGAGQRHTVALVDAYMTAKMLQETGHGTLQGLDPSLYTIDVIRGLPADVVYGRPFSALGASLSKGHDQAQALDSGLAALTKLAATDLQLAQTHSAKDWMQAEPTIVGWRRMLTGPGPHCTLCELAATRTYRKEDLQPIHEHCGCTVSPLWGDHAVASIGTVVRVENDTELGPRLMADSWSNVGPRLIA
jgi:hypothetical protein